jgi:hypothetical protein
LSKVGGKQVMQYCSKCRIKIKGSKVCCPLCGGKLIDHNSEGEADDDYGAFPILPKRKITPFTFMKIATFIAIVAEILLITVDLLTNNEYTWIGVVIVCVPIVWADIWLSMFYRSNIIKLVTFQNIVVIIADIIIDYLTGFKGWSVTWLVPVSLIGVGIFTIITSKVTKLMLFEYVRYLMLDTFISLLQLYPIYIGINWFIYPSVIAIVFYLIISAAIVIFGFRELKTASERYFNV